ncbi:hypothetical protein GCM10010368_45460 [Streptomyces roseiscleroticus]|uniref:Uncharacterized protein n=1 Tax=Streptomyces roseiscleroticus TaxID=1972 RepID=A0ABP5RQM9_9ACTN
MRQARGRGNRIGQRQPGVLDGRPRQRYARRPGLAVPTAASGAARFPGAARSVRIMWAAVGVTWAAVGAARPVDVLPLRVLPLRVLPLRVLPLRVLPLRVLPLRVLPLRALPLRPVFLARALHAPAPVLLVVLVGPVPAAPRRPVVPGALAVLPVCLEPVRVAGHTAPP